MKPPIEKRPTKSPIAGISGRLWSQAYDQALSHIAEFEKNRRIPTNKDVLNALKVLQSSRFLDRDAAALDQEIEDINTGFHAAATKGANHND